jgi:hypothetical protein
MQTTIDTLLLISENTPFLQLRTVRKLSRKKLASKFVLNCEQYKLDYTHLYEMNYHYSIGAFKCILNPIK